MKVVTKEKRLPQITKRSGSSYTSSISLQHDRSHLSCPHPNPHDFFVTSLYPPPSPFSPPWSVWLRWIQLNWSSKLQDPTHSFFGYMMRLESRGGRLGRVARTDCERKGGGNGVSWCPRLVANQKSALGRLRSLIGGLIVESRMRWSCCCLLSKLNYHLHFSAISRIMGQACRKGITQKCVWMVIRLRSLVEDQAVVRGTHFGADKLSMLLSDEARRTNENEREGPVETGD